MLILDFYEETQENKFKSKIKLFGRASKMSPLVTRERVIIADKLFYLINIDKSYVNDENFKRLLNSYMGKIIVKNAYKNLVPEEFLFNSNIYFSKALISALTKQIKVISLNNRNILIKLDEFNSCKEFLELVSIAKKVVFCFKKSIDFNSFQEECYNKFGAVVKTISECTCSSDYNYFLDLTKIDCEGKAELLTDGLLSVLYPDSLYFKKDKNIIMLNELGVDYKTACAVINT